MRTFVFITDIPEFVLQPTYTDSKGGADDKGNQRKNANRDPRYERLRRLLADHSSGVMLVMHLEAKGYGLALYASEEEALAACRATIVPEQPGMQYPPLKLRIVEKEKPLPPEPVYTPNITIEGQEVPKTSLAITRGLDLAYRGRSVPRWCPSTLAGKDCPFGMNCHRIHKAAVQRTVRKRPKIGDEDDGDGGRGGAQLSAAEKALVTSLVRNVPVARERLVPMELRPRQPSVQVPVAVAEVEALLSMNDSNTHEAAVAALADKVRQAMLHSSAGQQLSASGRPLFLRLGIPGGAPWDWALGSEAGLALLRQRCPLPANGAPTPLERDLLCQKLFYHLNGLNAFTSVEDALRALTCSANVAQGFAQFTRQGVTASSSPAADGSSNGVSDEAGEPHKEPRTAAAAELSILVDAWLSLPTVGCEVSAFLERGGRRVRGVVQRYGQLRLMLSAGSLPPANTATESNPTVLAHANAQLGTFAIVGAEQDELAETTLDTELRRRTRLFTRAVDTLRRHIAAHGATGPSLPANAAWCAQLALECVTTPGEEPEERVVVLSFKPYQRAMEECPMYTHLSTAGGTNGAAAVPAAATEVSWNTQKHAYVPLFSRETFEKLRR